MEIFTNKKTGYFSPNATLYRVKWPRTHATSARNFVSLSVYCHYWCSTHDVSRVQLEFFSTSRNNSVTIFRRLPLIPIHVIPQCQIASFLRIILVILLTPDIVISALIYVIVLTFLLPLSF